MVFSGVRKNRRFESGNRFNMDNRRFNTNSRGYQSGTRGLSGNCSRGDRRNRYSSENFSRRDRRQGGRLNILKVQEVQVDQSQSAEDIPIRLSATCMSPVDLPYDPILLNETFTEAFLDTGVEK
ncbi:hypothetical protein TNCV_4758181 [Trichonephila clavipes]|nr:hypothetical protein TNCV_4758181 [Trichonephila clavipes]